MANDLVFAAAKTVIGEHRYTQTVIAELGQS